MALNPKQFPSEIAIVKRSQINLCEYNPRTIDEAGRKALKRSMKKFGVLGGIVVNTRRGNVVCSGNQKVALLDSVNKYDPQNPDTDYELRVELVDVDETVEKEIVVVMNNPNVGGQWDFDKLREIVPDINYRDVGLTDADLSMIGVDFMFQSDGEVGIASDLTDLMSDVEEQHAKEVAERKEQRDAEKQKSQAGDFFDESQDNDEEYIFEDNIEKPEMTREEKIRHMKDVKQQVQQQAIETASNHDAYFMVSFTRWEDKAAFLSRYGYDPNAKFVKGEDFDMRLEGIEDDE